MSISHAHHPALSDADDVTLGVLKSGPTGEHAAAEIQFEVVLQDLGALGTEPGSAVDAEREG